MGGSEYIRRLFGCESQVATVTPQLVAAKIKGLFGCEPRIATAAPQLVTAKINATLATTMQVKSIEKS
jgi:hypothetical protein